MSTYSLNHIVICKYLPFLFVSLLLLLCIPRFGASPIVVSDLPSIVGLNTSWLYKGDLLSKPILFRNVGASKPIFLAGFFSCYTVDICYGSETDGSVFAVVIASRDGSDPRLIWTARRFPLYNGVRLEFTSEGNLEWTDLVGDVAWSTNTKGKSVAGLNLTETGNLVMFDVKRSVVWQSFDYPTNTLVPGQKLLPGKKLTSFSSNDWPWDEKLYYSLLLKQEGVFAFATKINTTEPYFQYYFNHTQERYLELKNGSFGNSNSDIFPGIPKANSTQFMQLGKGGHLVVYEYQPHKSFDGRVWEQVADLLPIGKCDYPVTCGRYAICKGINNCSSINVDDFYSFAEGIEATYYDPTKRKDRQLIVGFSVGGFLILCVVFGSICFIVKRKQHFIMKQHDRELQEDEMELVVGMLCRFSRDKLNIATNNFSKKLGHGGFGSVFEGVLRDGTKIAVKRLHSIEQVKRSFLSEVESIGRIHHVNLVRLIGFCSDKFNNYLVYEFMINGSLEKWIYNKNPSFILDWNVRKNIIKDVAKGLAYLHEECRQKIVHLDVKPQNILLDENFSAKISDFGLAKLIEWNQSKVVTIVRGTPGYLAPEWLRGVVTEKVDVYSFGVLLLEILCGRKHFEESEPEECQHLISLLKIKAAEGQLSDLVDKHCEDMQSHVVEVIGTMKLSIWCLQPDRRKRPSMSIVVKVLEGVMNVEENLDLDLLPSLTMEIEERYHPTDTTPMLDSILTRPR